MLSEELGLTVCIVCIQGVPGKASHCLTEIALEILHKEAQF